MIRKEGNAMRRTRNREGKVKGQQREDMERAVIQQQSKATDKKINGKETKREGHATGWKNKGMEMQRDWQTQVRNSICTELTMIRKDGNAMGRKRKRTAQQRRGNANGRK